VRDSTPISTASFIPDYSGELLTAGRVDKAVKVVVTHNLDKCLLFTNPPRP